MASSALCASGFPPNPLTPVDRTKQGIGDTRQNKAKASGKTLSLVELYVYMSILFLIRNPSRKSEHPKLQP